MTDGLLVHCKSDRNYPNGIPRGKWHRSIKCEESRSELSAELPKLQDGEYPGHCPNRLHPLCYRSSSCHVTQGGEEGRKSPSLSPRPERFTSSRQHLRLSDLQSLGSVLRLGTDLQQLAMLYIRRFTSLTINLGDILYGSALGNRILILNNREDADELLEKRSQRYSGRPHIPIVEL